MTAPCKSTSSPVAVIEDLAKAASSRLELWLDLAQTLEIRYAAEIGVYKGEFAKALLMGAPCISQYYLVDPWRFLPDWRKPANTTDEEFETFRRQALEATNFAAHRRIILRGTTMEVASEIPDNHLDFAYIDGDHTLRGITLDLINMFPKIKPGGWIGGDDFCASIWQHAPKYEPTLVFPFGVHFAEAFGLRIWGLPFNQFLIHKQADSKFEFIDLTGRYVDLELKSQFLSRGRRLARTARRIGRRLGKRLGLSVA